ncbi:transposase [Piscinibacter aquaticus]|uniref:Transposase n=1 Tax=Piscinibacter aquaticus TaxID=392597 RepID=A0A5C6U4I7_9BURK|nr:transposase [Piscinibacter aquaticus]
MARLPRLSVSGLPHLILQSGHNGQDVLTDAIDRDSYRRFLAQAAAGCGVAIHAYSLERARVLLLATPLDAPGMSRMMQSVGRRYAAWFNRRHGRSGTLWDGRFRATVVEPDRDLVLAMRHVEADAAQADDARAPAQARVSSMAHHVGTAIDPLVSDHPAFWALGNTPFERHAAYRALMEQPLGAQERHRFDEATRKGWALGSPAFVASLSQLAGRRTLPKRPGRPKKAAPLPDV